VVASLSEGMEMFIKVRRIVWAKRELAEQKKEKTD
jgi:hypothetical protein